MSGAEQIERLSCTTNVTTHNERGVGRLDLEDLGDKTTVPPKLRGCIAVTRQPLPTSRLGQLIPVEQAMLQNVISKPALAKR